MGASPTSVITKEPSSESRCVAVMRGAKREDQVPVRDRASKYADRNMK